MGKETGIAWTDLLWFSWMQSSVTFRAYRYDIKPLRSFVSTVMVIMFGDPSTFASKGSRRFQSPITNRIVNHSAGVQLGRLLWESRVDGINAFAPTPQTERVLPISATSVVSEAIATFPCLAPVAVFLSRVGQLLVSLIGHSALLRGNLHCSVFCLRHVHSILPLGGV
jgi:hypothetical protein